MFTTILTDIVTGLGTFVPAFFKALLDGFVALFVSPASDGGTISLTAVGGVALVFIVIGITYKILPTVVGWLRLRVRARKAKRARAK